MSIRQPVIALFTTEVEYMEATHANKEVVWLKRLCSEIGFKQQPVMLDFYSKSAIFLMKNLVYHWNTKHVDVQYHFVREMVESQKVLLEKVDNFKDVAG